MTGIDPSPWSAASHVRRPARDIGRAAMPTRSASRFEMVLIDDGEGGATPGGGRSPLAKDPVSDPRRADAARTSPVVPARIAIGGDSVGDSAGDHAGDNVPRMRCPRHATPGSDPKWL